MKQTLLILSLILVIGFSTFAQTEDDSIPITDPDVHFKMSWEDEKKQLDFLPIIFSKIVIRSVLY